jgi:hypothetical protein
MHVIKLVSKYCIKYKSNIIHMISIKLKSKWVGQQVLATLYLALLVAKLGLELKVTWFRGSVIDL